jgi:predicted SprT family Zn-dependent metalloprotease
VTAEPPFRLTERAAHIRALGRALLNAHGLTAWEFGFNSNVRRAGVCFYPHRGEPGRIELSVHFTQHNTDDEVRDTLLHEIAHALVGPGHGHDGVWKAKCRAIGAKPDACYGDEVEMPRGRWRATCPGCATEFDRHRRPARPGGWHCRPCGPTAGALKWEDARERRLADDVSRD